MLTREDYHEIKNQIAIAIGMTELSLRTLKKDPSKIETEKLIDRHEKTAKALEKVLALVDKGHQALKKAESGEKAAEETKDRTTKQ